MLVEYFCNEKIGSNPILKNQEQFQKSHGAQTLITLLSEKVGGGEKTTKKGRPHRILSSTWFQSLNFILSVHPLYLGLKNNELYASFLIVNIKNFITYYILFLCYQRCELMIFGKILLFSINKLGIGGFVTAIIYQLLFVSCLELVGP